MSVHTHTLLYFNYFCKLFRILCYFITYNEILARLFLLGLFEKIYM